MLRPQPRVFDPRPSFYCLSKGAEDTFTFPAPVYCTTPIKYICIDTDDAKLATTHLLQTLGDAITDDVIADGTANPIKFNARPRTSRRDRWISAELCRDSNEQLWFLLDVPANDRYDS